MRRFPLSHRLAGCFMKLGFSAVILQLLYISLLVTSFYRGTPAVSGAVLPSAIPEMLENAAVTAICVLSGGYLMERVLFESGR